MIEVILISVRRAVLSREEEPATGSRHGQHPVFELLKYKEGTKLTNICIHETAIAFEPVERTILAHKHHVAEPSR